MKIGHGSIETRSNNAGMLCRVCMQTMKRDDVFCTFDMTTNFHRVCMERWLRYSFDVMPMSQAEREMDPFMWQCEQDRERARFDEYRQFLLERLQGES